MGDGTCDFTMTCLSSGCAPTSGPLQRLFSLRTKVTKVKDVGLDPGYYEDGTSSYHVQVTPERTSSSLFDDLAKRLRDPEQVRLECNKNNPGWWVSWPKPIDITCNEHCNLQLSYFSLGSFVGLGTFVEHYRSAAREPAPEPAKNKTNKQKPPSSTKQRYRITQCMAHFAHYRQSIYLYFVDVKEPLGKQEQNGETHARHRFVIDYTSVRRVVLSASPGGNLVAFLHLLHPPLLYRVHKTHRPERDSDSDDETDLRKPVYVAQHEICPDSKWVRSVSFGKSVTKCNSGTLGACRVLAMAFPAAGADEHLKALSSLGALCASTSLFYGAVDTVPRTELAQGGAGIGEAEKELRIQDELPYGCRFALAAVWNTSAQVADELLVSKSKKQVASALQSMAAEDPTALEEALYALQQSLDCGRLASLQVGLKSLYDRYHSMRKQQRRLQGSVPLTGGILGQELPSHVVLVRRVVLTPTRLVPLPPEPISTSRIVRHFEPDHALRLVLRDEDGSRMSFSLGVQRQHFLFSITRPRLLDGFLIAGRRYEFLSTSSSQLRSHGAWFYSADSRGRSAADVRDALGDLSHLRVPSKYMARLGLAFSQSLGAVHVPRSCTSVEPDIEAHGPRKNLHYVFSDGVGRISPALLARVHDALPREGRPSAIQIRYGGCKGMLVLDPTLEGESIVFRQSQYKHPSDSEDLFVLKTSKPRVVKLNRPMITILSQKRTSSRQRSIPDEVFLKLQRQCLAPYAESLCDDAAAARLLHTECALELPYRELADAGLDLHTEPFFRSLLWTLHQRCLQQLREKANITIPPHQGRSMFGVMDETGTLRYGQVFVRYARDMVRYAPDDEYVVLEGPVVVTKNPCHHMGDIRKLQAVDVPELHHIRDCIVFPSVGKRPHPNEMAGSDLDGDEYSVIWHPELIFHRNDDPMHFYDSEAQEKEGPVEVEDMVEFMCHYIERDVVGLISNAHLAWADWLHDGVRSNMCTRLAGKVSRALDFAKLGRPENLSSSEKPAAYPDFMEKHSEKNTYLSQRVLGKLYRELSGMVLDSAGTGAVADVLPDVRLLIDGRERHSEVARRALERYRLRIRSLLTTYGIASEMEALSGAVMTMDARISEKRDHTDTAVVVENQVKHIMACTHDDFLDGLSGDYHEALCRASAWYSCAYEHGAQAEGFAWTVATHFLAILQDATPVIGPVRGSMRDRLTQALLPREDQLEMPLERVLFNNAFKLLRLWAKGNQGFLWGRESDNAAEKKSEDVASYLKLAKSALDCAIQQLLRQFGMERIRRKPGLLLVSCFWNLVQGRQTGGKLECRLADLAERTLHRMLYPGGAWSDNGKLPLEESVTPIGPTRTQVVLLHLPEGENSFFLEVVRQEDQFTAILKHWTQLDRVRLATWQDRGGEWFFQLMATGSPWALDRLKQTVVHERFRDELLRILTNQPV